ncbi:vacuolar sorting protein 39 domain 2-domain-containing protein [Piptocephalis cylindrospora]|uniref:Vacuolar sorting protein 39 domain 2-domain-containing protein n=1 Tax=Piptocephalis cylindrospora TaxID=1907219 RepID=A0A4P9Y793_9FUNG|nr:vacuolar sorting protein 39 domain 2-domain-containing protein [Piptocephalis cylindrospora]|eukprot:RKP14101.1 vacuolar sorting protein 39 domain 2-domain-containing protein [Piptocephalis cylindrospora]
MVNTFQVTAILEDLPVKVECIHTAKKKVYLGASSGALLVYGISTDESETKLVPQLTLTEFKKSFSRRPIEQLCVSPQLNSLLCLTDGCVNQYDLQTLTLRSTMAAPRGAHIFDVTHEMDDSVPIAVPTTVVRVAIGVKKRVWILTFRDGELAQSKDFPVTEKARCLTFRNPYTLCIGLAKEFLQMDIMSGECTDLLSSLLPPPSSSPKVGSGDNPGYRGSPHTPGSSDPQSTRVTPTTSTGGAIGSAALDAFSTALTLGGAVTMMGGITGGGSSRPTGTLCFPLGDASEGRMLTNKEAVSLVLGGGGRGDTQSIRWTGIPEEMIHVSPHLIATLPRGSGVEVRSLGTGNLMESLNLPHARFLSNCPEAPYAFAAGPENVWLLYPVPILRQVEDLMIEKEFDEAISLIHQSMDQIDEEYQDGPDGGRRKEAEVKKAFAHHLFQIGAFDKAISLFQSLNTDPAEVISLLPPEISGSLHGEGPGSPMQAKDLQEALGALIRFLTDRRRWIGRLLRQVSKDSDISPPSSIDPHLGPPTTSPSCGASPKSHDAASLTSGSYVTSGADDGPCPYTHAQLLSLAEHVDTALLRAYLMSNEALVGPLLRVANHCRVEESAKLLSDRGRYRELVDLYYGKGHHRKALQLLARLGSSQDAGPLQGVGPSIMYFQRLKSNQVDLILEFSTWILREDPESGLSIFLDDYGPVESFPRMRVVEHLEQFPPVMGIRYLEHVIRDLRDVNPECHTRLPCLYIRWIEQEMARQAGGGSDKDYNPTEMEKVDVDTLRKTLIAFLTQSLLFKPARVLSQLPSEGFEEERAIVLGRLKRFEQAVYIYVHRIKDLEKAESFCLGYATTEGNSIFLTLLKVLLKPPMSADKEEGLEDLMTPALDILNRYGAFIDSREAMKLLPKDTKIREMYPSLEKYLRASQGQGRENQIVLSLEKTRHFNTREEMAMAQARRVQITEERTCPQCFKRIGTSVFAVMPDGKVVHYSCRDRMLQALKDPLVHVESTG